MEAGPADDSMRKTPPLKLKDDPGNRRGNKWHFDGDLSALLDPRAHPGPRQRMAVVEDEGVDSANAESRR